MKSKKPKKQIGRKVIVLPNQSLEIFVIPRDIEHEYELKCIRNAQNMNLNVYEALQVIRTRLKHGQDVTDLEQETLERVRELLGEFYVEG